MADNPDDARGEPGSTFGDGPVQPPPPPQRADGDVVHDQGAPGAPSRDFARSQEDVARAVEAVLWRHARTNLSAAKSSCTGGEVRCALPMDADSFRRHQARAVVDEVFLHELDDFVYKTHLAEQTIGRLAESQARPLLMSPTQPETGRKLHWWNSRLVGWLFFLAVGAMFLPGLLKSCSV